MFTGRMKTEIPPALKALGDGMITAGARLEVLDLSDNAFGPIGVEGLAKLLESEVCSQLQELRLNNNGLGITGGRLLARALSHTHRPLRVFIAGRNRLENEGAKALAAVFTDMGTLEEVAMPQNGIYHVGISALSEAFKQNPRLSCLNLNDNTIGHKGAEAIAAALPCLKNLKSINFGDCLLKSKGAKALAKAFHDNLQMLECLDMSHNEIGRDACMELVDSIRSAPNSSERLARVVLAGNSLGSASNKKSMKDKLGACAELSDGEGSEDEYATDSDEEEVDDDDKSDEDSEVDEDDDLNHTQIDTAAVIGRDVTLDNSGVEEIETDVGRFLREPTVENLDKLGANAAQVIDAHLQCIKNPEESIQAYVEATFCVSGLSTSSEMAGLVSGRLYPIMLERAGQHHAATWLLANTMLRGLGLIKSENKEYKIRWSLPGCYSCLCDVIASERFPHAVRDTLKFFITSKLAQMPPETARVVKQCDALIS
ncbi:unnamed protein product [Diatraea saccharalis]|uniref:Ran-GTPase activating protein 1 C-terminal domain-containing protein n=1 Tax=Diatraea saccharalis TaxID=40085 RepID=A0A9N9WDS1_9NEOP|nr:unnamed protein product [Diatraea saccharalis]